ncbi:MAG: beta-propeller fold lactonase family protein [Candidatus Acidiferrales bacterium]
MAMKHGLLQLIALFLGAISLVNCSSSPSCVLVSNSAAEPVRGLMRTPAATATGCPVNTGGGGNNGSCSSTLTPADVLFGQASTGAVTTLAIGTGATSLQLMCTTANTGLGLIVVANVLATNKNYLYSLNNITHVGTTGSVTISGFAIGHVAPVTLTPLSTSFTITGTSFFDGFFAFQADPSGRFLTVTDATSSLVHILLISSVDGTLSEAAGSPFSVANALFTAVGASGQFLYVTDQSDGEIFIFLINLGANPVLTQIVNSPFVEPTHLAANAPISMQINLAGTFMYTANTQSISVLAIGVDGSLTSTGAPGTFTPTFNPQLFAMDPTGSFLYVLGSGTEGVVGFTIDNGTGALTLIAGSAFASGLSVSDILINPVGGQLYLLISGKINVYTITSGSGILVPPSGAAQFASSSNLAAAFVQ